MDTTPITFYGGAKGGGKSHGLRNIFLARCFQYPKSIAKIFRRTYPELEDNHIAPLFKTFPELRPFYNESKKVLTLPNQSTLQFCHCKNAAEVSLYQGRETHYIGIDEAGQWTEGMFRTLLGSNRSSDPNIKPRVALTGNPGGIGHGWLKRLFIQRLFNERENPDDYAFIQALVDDNEALMQNDPEYVKRLESEPNQALRRAYRHGDWDIFAGQFFQEISKSIHFIDPISIPDHWNRFGGYDYGYNHPGAFGWFTNDEDGNVYLYREFVKDQLRVDQFAHEINKFPETKKLTTISAGHDCWTQKNVLRDDREPPTIAEEFLRHGIYLEKANIDRIQGASQLRSYLAWQGKPNSKPQFYIFNTCPITFDAISRMIHNPNRLEDVLKVDAEEGDPYSGDDAYDMARYALMSRPSITQKLPFNPKYGSPEWEKHQEEMHIKAISEKIQKEKDMKSNKGGYGSWQKNKKGVSDWNEW